MALVLNKPVVQKITRRIADFFLDLYRRYLDAAGPWIDVWELPGDDYSGTGMSMVSSDTFDEFYAEPWKEIIALIRTQSPRAKILFHSDGNITHFVKPFIDAGADVVHSLESGVGNDIQALKNTYGTDICFWGALDVKTPMQTSIEATEAEIEKKMGVLKSDGGWVMAAENHVQPDVQPKCLVRAYEYARQIGRY